MAVSKGTPPWVVAAWSAALVLIFLGERVLVTIAWLREALTGVGIVAVLALTVLRWMAVRASDGERRAIERALAILSTLGALAVLLYMTTAEPFDAHLGVTKLASETRARYQAGATVAFVALLACSWLPMLFAERALFPMRRAERVEWRRVRDALGAGLAIALCAAYGALFCFALGELDVKADFSYFHTARPSEKTRNVAASANDKIRVLAFFPDVSETGSEVTSYLHELARGLPNLEVEVNDRLLVPKLAKDAKITEDGVIVFERAGQRETIAIGTDIQKARPKLKTLDNDVQKALFKVLRDKRTAYFTVGHGELENVAGTQQNDGRTGKGMRELLEQQNYATKDLGSASGLGVDVPDDATLLVVLGPQAAFLPEEVASVKRYADRGGKLFLCLDPDAKIDLSPLADVVGLTVGTAILANDKVHLRRRFNDSDRIILATNRFSSHASVSTLSRVGSRPVVFLGAGALDKKAGADGALKIDFAVRAMPDTFDDANGNFKLDPPGEKKGNYALAAAVSKTVRPNVEMRAFALGDSDVVSDAALANEANLILAADAVHWLTGEESFAGAMSTAEDVRIEHTKQKDLVWFYGTIFGAPALVLGTGLLYTRRIRKKKTPKKEASS